MKRILITSALCALSLSMLPARAAETEPLLTASGTIAVPAGFTRAQRCFDDAGGANGVFGWILPVTAGYTFTLTTPTPSMDDVNIGFYTRLTPCEDAAAVAGAYENDVNNESGTVPTGATRAIIYTGSLPVYPEHTGTARPNTAFTYTQIAPAP